jgi:hypothetical protein
VILAVAKMESPDIMAFIPEGEARYRVIQLVNRYPELSLLLLKLQNEGVDWVALLGKLEQAVIKNIG